MPESKTATLNTFCWTELSTSDPAAARKFYTDLFGWTVAEMPMPDGSTYAMMRIGDKDVCGVRALGEDAKKMGAPPHWLSYVAVKSADDGAKAVAKLGGKALAGPMDIGPGRMVVAQDPTGGVFALWQETGSMGTAIAGETNTLFWTELVTTNVDAAGKFYTGLFGWKANPVDMGPMGTYTVLKAGEKDAGGMLPIPPGVKDPHTAWVNYYAVADCDATVAKAQKKGAQVHMPATDAPGVGRFAVLADPQGAVFAVIKPAPRP